MSSSLAFASSARSGLAVSRGFPECLAGRRQNLPHFAAAFPCCGGFVRSYKLALGIHSILHLIAKYLAARAPADSAVQRTESAGSTALSHSTCPLHS